MRILSFFFVGFLMLSASSFAGRYDEVRASYENMDAKQLVDVIADESKTPQERIGAFLEIQEKDQEELLAHDFYQILETTFTVLQDLEDKSDNDEDDVIIKSFFIRNGFFNDSDNKNPARMDALKKIGFTSDDIDARRRAILEMHRVVLNNKYGKDKDFEIDGLNIKTITLLPMIKNHDDLFEFVEEVLSSTQGQLGADVAKTLQEMVQKNPAPDVVLMANILKIRFLCECDSAGVEATIESMFSIIEQHSPKRADHALIFIVQQSLSTAIQKARAKKMLLETVRNKGDLKRAKIIAMQVETIPDLSRDEKIELLDVALTAIEEEHEPLKKARFILSRIGFGGLSDDRLCRFEDILYSEEALANLWHLRSMWGTSLSLHTQPKVFIEAVCAKAKDDNDPLQDEAAFTLLTQFGFGASYHVPFSYEIVNQASATSVIRTIAPDAKDDSKATEAECNALIDSCKKDIMPLIFKIAKDCAHPHFGRAYSFVLTDKSLCAEYEETYMPWFVGGLVVETPDAELMPRLDFLVCGGWSHIFGEAQRSAGYHDPFETPYIYHIAGMHNPYTRALVMLYLATDRDDIKEKVKDILTHDPEGFAAIGFDVNHEKLERMKNIDFRKHWSWDNFYGLFRDEALAATRTVDRDAVVLEHIRKTTDKDLRFKLAELLFKQEPFEMTKPFIYVGECKIAGAGAKRDKTDLPPEVVGVYLEDMRDDSNPQHQCYVARELFERPCFRKVYRDEIYNLLLSMLVKDIDQESFCSIFYCLAKEPETFMENALLLTEKLIKVFPKSQMELLYLRFILPNLWNIKEIREKYGIDIVNAFLRMPKAYIEPRDSAEYGRLVLTLLTDEDVRKKYTVELAGFYIEIALKYSKIIGRNFLFGGDLNVLHALTKYPEVIEAYCSEIKDLGFKVPEKAAAEQAQKEADDSDDDAIPSLSETSFS